MVKQLWKVLVTVRQTLVAALNLSLASLAITRLYISPGHFSQLKYQMVLVIFNNIHLDTFHILT